MIDGTNDSGFPMRFQRFSKSEECPGSLGGRPTNAMGVAFWRSVGLNFRSSRHALLCFWSIRKRRFLLDRILAAWYYLGTGNQPHGEMHAPDDSLVSPHGRLDYTILFL